MKKLFVILIAGLFFISCSPCKRLARKCPPQIIHETKDSIIIKDSIVYKDKEVPYYIPGDTQYVEKPVPIKEDISPVWVENKFALAKAWVNNSRLKLLLETKEQTLMLRIDSAIQMANHWEYRWTNEKQTETITIREKFIPKIYKIAMFATVSGVILLLVYLYIKIKGGLLKSLVNRFKGLILG